MLQYLKVQMRCKTLKRKLDDIRKPLNDEDHEENEPIHRLTRLIHSFWKALEIVEDNAAEIHT